MDFPFRAAISYLTPEQRKSFEMFLAEEPEYKTIYVNEDGEERVIFRVHYPIGCVTKDTVFVTVKGEVRYATPLATADGGYALVSWRSPDDKKHGLDTSEKWLAWLGKDYKTKPQQPRRPDAEVLRDRKIQMARIAMMNRTDDAKKEISRVTKPFPSEEKKGASKPR
jgi:hypothetical protein